MNPTEPFCKEALIFTWLKIYFWGEVNQWSVEHAADMYSFFYYDPSY